MTDPIGPRLDELERLWRSTEPDDPAAALSAVEPDPAAMLRVAERQWAAAIPRRFLSARLDDLDPGLAGKLLTWGEPSEEPRPGLVLTGPVGSGKSHAACAAVRPLILAGRSLAFWPVVRLLDQLRPDREPDPYDDARSVDLLILDDLGAERATAWTAERLYAIVNDRWLDELPTIVTTNLAPPALVEAVGERLSSRLLGGATLARLAGHDRRMKP